MLLNKLSLFKHSHITEDEFLKEYWHKKPLLIKNAIEPTALDPLPNKSQLLELSFEEDIQSRIVKKNSEKEYNVEYGPFNQSDYHHLNGEIWNLLVSDIDKWQPKSRKILRYFDFIRNWIFDDIMLSCGSVNGTVGPHTDHYDVFLLQIQGQRNWQYCYNKKLNPQYINDLDIKVLANFDADEQHLLYPGDVLYLPPEVAHYGIALSQDCVTCSIGTRTPSHAELITSFVDSLAQEISSDHRFNEPEYNTKQATGELKNKDLLAIKDILIQRLDPDKKHLSSWFGQYITEYRSLFYEYNQEQYRDDLNQTKHLYLSSFSKSCYFLRTDFAELFVNGQQFKSSKLLAQMICNDKMISADKIKLLSEHDMGILELLFENGAIQHGIY